jgi:hypothetical protein
MSTVLPHFWSSVREVAIFYLYFHVQEAKVLEKGGVWGE